MSELTTFDKYLAGEEDDFNTSLAYNKFEGDMSIASQVSGAAIATVVDAGASMWNSLTPDSLNVDERDFMQRISNDAARMYDEHPDAIGTAGFIIGSLIPGGIAMKGMGLLRKGAKGASWFSDAGKLENLAKVDGLVRGGADTSKALRALNFTMLRNGVANNVLDAAVAEALMLGAMNEHPMLEDYWDDPVKNFGISLAFGGVIGGGIGHIADRALVRGAIADTKKDIISTVFKGYQEVDPAATNIGQMIVQNNNIKTWENLLKDPNLDPATKEMTEFLVLEEKAKAVENLSNLKFEGLDTISVEQRDALLASITSDASFQSANKLKFYTTPESADIAVSGNVKRRFKGTSDNPVSLLDEVSDKGLQDTVFHPEWGTWTSVEDAPQVSRYVAKGEGAEALIKYDANQIGKTNRSDAVFKTAGSTMDADGNFLAAIKTVDEMDFAGMKDFVVDEKDAFVLDALAIKYNKNPDAFNKITIKGATGKIKYGEAETIKVSEIPTNNFSVLEKITDATKATRPPYSLKHSNTLSDETASALEGWIQNNAADKDMIRRGMEKLLRGGKVAGDEAAIRIAKELRESKESVELRDVLRSAVGDHVYLWRGQSPNRKGHSPVESYTTDKSIAESFASSYGTNPTLHKVAVDDIIAHIEGISEKEILVGAPRAPAINPEGITISSPNGVIPARVLNIDDIKRLAIDAKEDTIASMLAEGAPMQSISIMTNTPLPTVQMYAMGKDRLHLRDMEKQNVPMFHYGSAEAVDSAFDVTKKPIRASHSEDKIAYAKVASNLDSKFAADAQREYMGAVVATTKSAVMQRLGNIFFGDTIAKKGLSPMLSMLRQGVAEVSNENLGNAFISSADSFVRKTSVGRIITHVGKVLADTASDAATKTTLPIAQKMDAIAKNEVEVIEFLNVLNVMDTLKGWRDVVNGKLVQKTINPTTKKEELIPVFFQGNELKIQSPKVLDLLESLKHAGQEAYEMSSTLNAITGRGAINDIGFWVPSTDFRDKHIAYVWNAATQETKVLWGNTVNELKHNMSVYKLGANERIVSGDVTVATKAEQALHNTLKGRLDPLTMQVANVEMQKTGSSANAIVKANTDQFSNIISAYEYLIERNVKRFGQYAMHDTIDRLDKMSAFNKHYTDSQPVDAIAKFLNKEEDGAAKVRNILLGNSNINEYAPWKSFNESMETVANYGINTISDVVKGAIKPLGGMFGNNKGLSPEILAKQDYAVISRKLEEAGVPNPWAAFDDAVAAQLYQVAKLPDSKNVAKRLVYSGNALAATMALRVLDLASPLVNAMSMPILTSMAMRQNLPAKLLNASLAKDVNPTIVGIMHDGMRLSNSVRGEALAKAWEEQGLMSSFVSEANAAMRLTRKFDKSALAHVDNFVDSKVVETLSWTADKTEAFLRRKTMFSGYVLAKKLYPNIDDTGATIFARDFMDRSLGNYHSGQRPVFFQGTMGVAMGLFQTYMLTMAQNIYRGIELKDFKGIGKAMLAQTTIFGGQSLPGFEMVSTTIGDHYSDENIDLTTGTFRALDDRTATALLHGLPSSLGPALHTRGDISPRIPVPLGDPQKIAAVNMLTQTLQVGQDIVNASANNGGDIGKSVAQALSLQSVSRPLARVSELVSGSSVTRAGDTVASSNEVYTATGIFSRLLGARPIEEAKAREALYLDKSYGALDRDTRMKFSKELKMAIRNGSLTDEKLSSLAYNFMKHGGSARAWQAHINDAMANSNLSGREQVIDKLRPDSPLMHMMDNLDGGRVE